MSSKICLFCSCVMVDDTCRAADKSGVEEAIGWWFLREILVGVQEVVANLLGYVKSDVQAYLAAGAERRRRKERS